MNPDFRSWVLATVTLLVVFLILADISELEQEMGHLLSGFLFLKSGNKRPEGKDAAADSDTILDIATEACEAEH